MSEIFFFGAGHYFSRYFLASFSPRNQSAGYFAEIIHKPLKSQMVGPCTKSTNYLLSLKQ